MQLAVPIIGFGCPLGGVLLGSLMRGREFSRRRMSHAAAYYLVSMPFVFPLIMYFLVFPWWGFIMPPALIGLLGYGWGGLILGSAALPMSPRPEPGPRCRGCGYNLTGNASGVCSEFGTPCNVQGRKE